MMNDLYQVLKAEMIERASRLMVQAEREDARWTRCDEVYGEYLEELGKRLKDPAFFGEFESAIGALKVCEEDYLYWQGVLDGVALLKILNVI